MRDGWIRVPVGDDAERWATRGGCRRVLLIVHNVTSATRLLDVVGLFRDDLRVQLLATCPGTSPFRSGTAELLAALGVPVLPWEQALELGAELVVSASFGGQLEAVKGKLAVLSHGVGYNKRLATPDTGHRTPDTGHRTPDTGHRTPGRAAPLFGLSREWALAPDGSPVADALVLSHPVQLDRFRASCPEAAGTAVLGGDPCFDRILAARPRRKAFRRALGVRPGQRLVLLNSTWNPTSLFGGGGGDGGGDSEQDDVLALLLRALPELPVDEYRVAAVLHPNVWHGHGPGQVRLWLDGAARAGLTLVDPVADWRQALIAADAVVGDFGSVSYYAAALGTPVLVAAPGPTVIEPSSQVAEFVREAPRLDPYGPLRPQLDAALRGGRVPPGPAQLTSSCPGGSAARLRALFYGLIGIPEPAAPALLDPLPLPAHRPGLVTAPLRVLTEVGGGAVTLRRFAAARYEPDGPGHGHLAVHEDTLDPGALALADLIVQHTPPGLAEDPRLGTPRQWAAEALSRHRSCSLAALVTGPETGTVVDRAGGAWELSTAGLDPAAAASAWLARRAAHGEPPAELAVRVGDAVHRVAVRRS
ncbi:hypothetical protein VM95_25315 [Streptomyces rubellomurinus]|uniref:Translation initiation factor 2 n=1 Tax=Streptomyces rubellomurinus (strain ATCC 31215) TaxID=359131 RepID=A0A0F2TBL4_STRR3|nr:hypothetical protein VM95_25315 [Streptomyces rubellomurinus]